MGELSCQACKPKGCCCESNVNWCGHIRQGFTKPNPSTARSRIDGLPNGQMVQHGFGNAALNFYHLMIYCNAVLLNAMDRYLTVWTFE